MARQTAKVPVLVSNGERAILIEHFGFVEKHRSPSFNNYDLVMYEKTIGPCPFLSRHIWREAATRSAPFDDTVCAACCLSVFSDTRPEIVAFRRNDHGQDGQNYAENSYTTDDSQSRYDDSENYFGDEE